jgi:hypothetical protein
MREEPQPIRRTTLRTLLNRAEVGHRPSRLRRRTPKRFWKVRSSSPSFLAAQMNAHATTANVRIEMAAITTPRKVLTAAAYDPSGDRPLAWASVLSLDVEGT